MFYYVGFHELAQYLVHTRTEDETRYVTSDGEGYMDEEEAIEHTIKWLNQEHIDKED